MHLAETVHDSKKSDPGDTEDGDMNMIPSPAHRASYLIIL